MYTSDNHGARRQRRGSLRLAGVALAVVLAAGGLAACGDDSSSGGDAADTIKIGLVTPQTGPLAPFAEADTFVAAQISDFYADGIEINGQTFAVEVISRDSESSTQVASSVAQELIQDEQVDILLASSTPDTTVPVGQACDTFEVPCITSVAPWQPHYLGLGGTLPPAAEPSPDSPAPAGSVWNFHFVWGLEDIIGVFINMWNEVAPGGTVGALWPNDPDGNAWGDPNVGFPPALEEAGFTVVDPGRFPLDTTDFTAQINAFKEAGVTIVSGVLPPPVFGAFWAQAQQQGFTPQVVTMGKALLFPSAVESFENPSGLSSEVWWTNESPFTSSITGQTANELATAFEEATGQQWTQPLGFAHALFEVAMDSLTRAGGPGDAQAIREAIGATQLATVVGDVDFSAFPFTGITKTPLVGGQWLPGAQYPYELVIVENQGLPALPLGGQLQPIGG